MVKSIILSILSYPIAIFLSFLLEITGLRQYIGTDLFLITTVININFIAVILFLNGKLKK